MYTNSSIKNKQTFKIISEWLVMIKYLILLGITGNIWSSIRSANFTVILFYFFILFQHIKRYSIIYDVTYFIQKNLKKFKH